MLKHSVFLFLYFTFPPNKISSNTIYHLWYIWVYVFHYNISQNTLLKYVSTKEYFYSKSVVSRETFTDTWSFCGARLLFEIPETRGISSWPVNLRSWLWYFPWSCGIVLFISLSPTIMEILSIHLHSLTIVEVSVFIWMLWLLRLA